ncbi:MAG: Uma2 family endonuclease [Gemmataceae bacterium]
MTTPRILLEIRYHDEAQRYLRSLKMENFMESTAQAGQRAITLASLAQLEGAVRGFHLYNELLVQYPRKGHRKPGQVVPDNMVVLFDGELTPSGSYDVPLQPAGPFWVLEYVSRSNRRKDYDRNVLKYEKELKVPYYFLFEPEVKEMTLYRMNDAEKYVSVKPDDAGRVALPELDLEIGIVEDWVRYWFRGALLELPAELARQTDALRDELRVANQHLGQERQARETLEAENARLRAELEAMKKARLT